MCPGFSPIAIYIETTSDLYSYTFPFTKPFDIINSLSEKAIKIWQKYFNKKPKILVIIEPVVKSESYQKTSGANIIGDTHLNRDWGFENWQKVVDAFKENVAFLQPFRGNVRKLKLSEFQMMRLIKM